MNEIRRKWSLDESTTNLCNECLMDAYRLNRVTHTVQVLKLYDTPEYDQMKTITILASKGNRKQTPKCFFLAQNLKVQIALPKNMLMLLYDTTIKLPFQPFE